ncbi:hypothetical protein B0H11DRAFT_2215131 [Mycena galericulata]|nr:hypothetical protein B0H11DRAFT_2215131 [Mycena galericulata]
MASPIPHISLSVSEARAFMMAEIYQPRSRPLLTDTATRPSFGIALRVPSEYDYLKEQILRGNIMRRSHHVVRCETRRTPAAQPLTFSSLLPSTPAFPSTPDDSIRRMFRRRSSVTCPTQFEDQYNPEPLY